MSEHGWHFVDRRALLCLIAGTAGVVVILLGTYCLSWRPAIALPAIVLLGAAPLAAAACISLLAARHPGTQNRQSPAPPPAGPLVGDVAHDFNNLLAGILGAAEVLDARVGQAGVEREMIDTIIAGTHRAGQLSSSLLVAAKIDPSPAVPSRPPRVNHEPEIATTGKPAPDSEPPHGHGLILLVDDEQTILALASMVLVQLGYEVILASRGRKGIDLYEKEQGRIRGVVLDMAMPDMDGLEVLRELKRINPQVKVAIAAGYIPEKCRADLETAGAAAIIQKPYRMTEIGTVLAAILGTEQRA